jgi:predicted HicB family RNase H-like nuclease
MMDHKGYSGQVEFDDDAGIFHGEVVDLRDVITFEADCVEDLRQAFRDSVDDYLEFCAERNEEPEKPFSGQFLMRVDTELHREIFLRAKNAKKSINGWVSETLANAVATE